jgi:hypothetical protein
MYGGIESHNDIIQAQKMQFNLNKGAKLNAYNQAIQAGVGGDMGRGGINYGDYQIANVDPNAVFDYYGSIKQSVYSDSDLKGSLYNKNATTYVDDGGMGPLRKVAKPGGGKTERAKMAEQTAIAEAQALAAQAEWKRNQDEALRKKIRAGLNMGGKEGLERDSNLQAAVIATQGVEGLRKLTTAKSFTDEANKMFGKLDPSVFAQSTTAGTIPIGAAAIGTGVPLGGGAVPGALTNSNAGMAGGAIPKFNVNTKVRPNQEFDVNVDLKVVPKDINVKENVEVA